MIECILSAILVVLNLVILRILNLVVVILRILLHVVSILRILRILSLIVAVLYHWYPYSYVSVQLLYWYCSTGMIAASTY